MSPGKPCDQEEVEEGPPAPNTDFLSNNNTLIEARPGEDVILPCRIHETHSKKVRPAAAFIGEVGDVSTELQRPGSISTNRPPWFMGSMTWWTMERAGATLGLQRPISGQRTGKYRLE